MSLIINIPNMKLEGGILLQILRIKHFSIILIILLQTKEHVNTEEHGIFSGFTHNMDITPLE